MDLTSNIYHVFAPNGLLLKRVNAQYTRHDYGTPIAQSGNGRILVYRRTNTFLSLMHEDRLLKEKAL